MDERYQLGSEENSKLSGKVRGTSKDICSLQGESLCFKASNDIDESGFRVLCLSYCASFFQTWLRILLGIPSKQSERILLDFV